MSEALVTAPFESALKSIAHDTESELERLLLAGEPAAAPLVEAMRYAALGGGKRVRAFLVHASGRTFGATPAACRRVGAAVECIHAYSLVHDDLPAMDDAATRRGRPACHRAFDEATAILAGDALQALAFEILAADDWPCRDGLRARLMGELATASGYRGMAGGQMIDLLAEGASLDVGAITRLQRLKTGALIAFACRAGGLLGEADGAQIERLDAYSADLGLAFQIKDDLLDVTGDEEALGKDPGRDVASAKATFVSLLGIAGASRELESLRASARTALEPFGDAAHWLKALVDFVIDRRS